ncbi:hypothetical protein, partial [Streptomyces sp. NPDC059538]|uniref:hypothetical protein n=1 Tax=Streptomyces sp. NPDC059538 TaxID=3346860 RepID=UPI0036BBA8C4
FFLTKKQSHPFFLGSFLFSPSPLYAPVPQERTRGGGHDHAQDHEEKEGDERGALTSGRMCVPAGAAGSSTPSCQMI